MFRLFTMSHKAEQRLKQELSTLTNQVLHHVEILNKRADEINGRIALIEKRNEQEDCTHPHPVRTYGAWVKCDVCNKQLASVNDSDAYMLAWHKEQAAKLENKETDNC